MHPPFGLQTGERTHMQLELYKQVHTIDVCQCTLTGLRIGAPDPARQKSGRTLSLRMCVCARIQLFLCQAVCCFALRKLRTQWVVCNCSQLT